MAPQRDATFLWNIWNSAAMRDAFRVGLPLQDQHLVVFGPVDTTKQAVWSAWAPARERDKLGGLPASFPTVTLTDTNGPAVAPECYRGIYYLDLRSTAEARSYMELLRAMSPGQRAALQMFPINGDPYTRTRTAEMHQISRRFAAPCWKRGKQVCYGLTVFGQAVALLLQYLESNKFEL